ncbi:hypothetical protein [Streptomyces colonosanans]|nr:hypothetical protein [Streptomyces colonosanans]
MRNALRLAVFGVLLGLLLSSCSGYQMSPTTPASSTSKGASSWP